MKKKEIQELKNKSEGELQKSLEENYGKLRKLSFDLANNKLKDTTQIKKVKVAIATIKTFIKQTSNK